MLRTLRSVEYLLTVEVRTYWERSEHNLPHVTPIGVGALSPCASGIERLVGTITFFTRRLRSSPRPPFVACFNIFLRHFDTNRPRQGTVYSIDIQNSLSYPNITLCVGLLHKYILNPS